MFQYSISKTAIYLITFLCCLTSSAQTTNELELSGIVSSDMMWEESAREFAKNNRQLDWRKTKEEVHYLNEAGLKLWGYTISSVTLNETMGVLSQVNFTLINKEKASESSVVKFKKKASLWKKLIDKKLKTKAKFLPSLYYGNTKLTRMAWKRGETIIVLTMSLSDTPQKLELGYYEKKQGAQYIKLKGQQNELPKTNENDNGAQDETEIADESKRLAPDKPNSGKSEKDIRQVIREISARKAPEGVSRKVQAAVNLLNVYRYLSSVPFNVTANKDMIEASYDAAKICNKKGELSHGFGHSTDKCNLAMSSSSMTMEKSVTQYMDDAGANNRAKRGHRRWCLNHKMKETGFGIDDAYSAMYSLDQNGKPIRENYSYPGHGNYPIKYLHGNGWSYYFAQKNAPADCKVSVWKLRKRDDEIPTWDEEPDGTKLPCDYIHIYQNSVVFEPEPDPITKKGHYLVRIEGKSVKEQYVVKLF